MGTYHFALTCTYFGMVLSAVFDMYILNITTPPSTREMSNHLLDYET